MGYPEDEIDGEIPEELLGDEDFWDQFDQEQGTDRDWEDETIYSMLGRKFEPEDVDHDKDSKENDRDKEFEIGPEEEELDVGNFERRYRKEREYEEEPLYTPNLEDEPDDESDEEYDELDFSDEAIDKMIGRLDDEFEDEYGESGDELGDFEDKGARVVSWWREHPVGEVPMDADYPPTEEEPDFEDDLEASDDERGPRFRDMVDFSDREGTEERGRFDQELTPRARSTRNGSQSWDALDPDEEEQNQQATENQDDHRAVSAPRRLAARCRELDVWSARVP